MAVTSVTQDWKGRGATADENAVRTLKRRWKVTTDSNDTGEPEVIDGVVAEFPSAALYQPHPHWPWAVCRKLSAEPHEGPRVWLVNAEYSSAPFKASGDGSGTGGGPGGNPTAPNPAQSNETPANQRPPTIKIGGRDITKVLEKDAETGDRVLNPVGDPFDPLPEVTRTPEVITVTFFVLPADLNWATRRLYRDSINDTEITLLGATYEVWTLRCAGYDVDGVWETGEEGMEFFFQLTVTLQHDPDGWWPKILATGRRQKVTLPLVGDVLVAIVDHAGQPVADPVPLTAAGVPVAPGGTYHYVEPSGYVARDWTNILA